MAIPEFFLAWIDEPVAFDEATHAVKDEKIIWLNRVLTENDFPNLSIRIQKPSEGLLSPNRKRWAWVSYRKMDGTIVPLFLGWMVAEPEDMVTNIITLTFKSQPSDFAEQKIAVANAKKVLPKYDPAFIRVERREDPDVALEGYPEAWHMSHLFPLTVSTSHLINGEDGHVNFDSGSRVDYASVKRTMRTIPIRRIKFTAEAYWEQSADGEVDVKIPILQAAKAAGTQEDGMVWSYTGQGLADDWPKNDDNIGSGWRVKSAIATFVSQEPKEVAMEELPVTWQFTGSPSDPVLHMLRDLDTVPGDALFYRWSLIPEFIAKYKVSRRREETLIFNLWGGIQPVFTDPGDEEVLELTATAIDLTELVDADGTLAPIRDVRRSQYFTTGRGRQSLQFFMNIAASQMIARARCINIEFKVPFEDGIDPTCRMTGSLNDPRFVGGATGKIVGTSLLADPNRGEFTCIIRIACSIGEGQLATPELGEALYIDDEYIDESYYVRSGESFSVVDGALVYDDFVPAFTDDDGMNFFYVDHKNAVVSCELVNGPDAQEAVLDSKLWVDIDEAVDALEEVSSEFRLVMMPLEGSFKTRYRVFTTPLTIAKTIDFRAVA